MKKQLDSDVERRVISERRFFQKLKASAVVAGRETVVVALKLYFALLDKDTPHWVKVTIGSALVYFLVPLDVIPDFLPGGYTDDLGTMLAALATLKSNIKPSHGERAEAAADRFFPSVEKSGK